MESALRFIRLADSDSELTEKQFVQLEKDVFLGFYSVRKLIEAPGKLTDRVKETKLTVRCYPNIKRVDSFNSHKIDEVYDLEAGFFERRPIKFVCGRIIHSYVFSPLVSEEGVLRGIVFTSDIDRNKKLYSLSAKQIAALFNRIGRDEVVSLLQARNSTTGDMEVVSAT